MIFKRLICDDSYFLNDDYEPTLVTTKLLRKHSGTPLFSLGTPLITNAKELAKSKSVCVIHFPSREGQLCRSRVALPPNFLIRMDSKNVFSASTIKEIDVFDWHRVTRIVDFVKENGKMTFVMSNQRAAAEFISNLTNFQKCFRYSTSFGLSSYKDSNDSLSNAALTAFINIYDLQYAVPTFDKRKADGIAIAIGLFWPKLIEKESVNPITLQVFFALNNHSANILVADGEKINEIGFVKKDYLEHMASALERDALRLKKERENAEREIRKKSEAEKRNIGKGKAKKNEGSEKVTKSHTILTSASNSMYYVNARARYK